MRWIPFVILVYVLIVLQTTMGSALTFVWQGVGRIGPDLLAIMAVFVALRALTLLDAMIAGWTLGLALGLTAVGGPGTAASLGPMSLTYAMAAGLIFKLREVVFIDRFLTQAALAFVFCLFAHVSWLLIQAALARAWDGVGRMLIQAMGLAVYTGLLMMVGFRLLRRIEGWFISAPMRRGRGARGALRMM